MITHFDLFSGIGGFALAAKWARFQTIGFAEIDPFCAKVLEKNFPGVYNYGDVKGIDTIPKVNLLTGGFPCQPFSVAGSKKGVKDDRYLWPEFKRIIANSKPDWVIAENVPGIIPHVDTMLKDLENEGYSWWAYLIPASAVGAPHKRERLWIVAHANSIGRNEWFNTRQERHIQSDIKQYIEALQSKWPQFVPKSWSSFNAQNWIESTADTYSTERIGGQSDQKAVTERSQWAQCGGKAMAYKSGFDWQEAQPPIPGVDARLPNIVDRNRALGNAIVPQVIYPILMFIAELAKNET